MSYSIKFNKSQSQMNYHNMFQHKGLPRKIVNILNDTNQTNNWLTLKEKETKIQWSLLPKIQSLYWMFTNSKIVKKVIHSLKDRV